MGGHGSSSGLKQKAASKVDDGVLKEVKTTLKNMQEMKQDGVITDSEYTDLLKSLASNYNISQKDMAKIMGDVVEESTAGVGDISKLPGQAGNPWPPDASSKHIPYSEGGGKAIWTLLGGGIANGGVTSQTAKDMNTAVKAYTGSQYGSIRKAYIAGDTTSTQGKKAANVQAFIEKSIETGNGWNGGTTYRGIGGLSDSTWQKLVSLKPGDSVDCNLSAPASWSTKRSTSEGFGGSKNHITFVHLGSSQKGVSVDHISSCEGENEVLVSGKAKYKVVGVSPTKSYGYGSQTYIYVEDAD